jgi:hypothetical protein
MERSVLSLFVLISTVILAQPGKVDKDLSNQKQFVLFDVSFTYTKENADTSTPSKSHYYVTGEM